MTPSFNNRPILTVRNVRALLYAILNYYEKWMNIQDEQELYDKEQSYMRTISKYRLMISKLNYDSVEALEQSSNSKTSSMISNVPGARLNKLNMEEIVEYVEQ